MATYETHITVDSDPATVARARSLADELGLEWTHIVLSSGERASQPMITCDRGESLDEQRAIVAEIAAQCELNRIRVLRIKTEGALDCDECAADEARGQCATDGRYFESHVKVLVDDDEGARDRVRRVAAEHDARFSRNARRAGSVEERFVTVRSREVSREVARDRTAALVSALEAAGVTVRSVRAEYVLFDSDFAVDRGWGVADALHSDTSDRRSTR